MKVQISSERCQGHGRCYDTAPELFDPDDIGNSHEVGDGTVAPELEHKAKVAVGNCPEHAITIEESS